MVFSDFKFLGLGEFPQNLAIIRTPLWGKKPRKFLKKLGLAYYYSEKFWGFKELVGQIWTYLEKGV